MSHTVHVGNTEEGKDAKMMRCVQTLTHHAGKTDIFYDSCEQYATSMCVLGSKDCSGDEVTRLCDTIRRNFTAHDKEEYCTMLVAANDKFWVNKFR